MQLVTVKRYYSKGNLPLEVNLKVRQTTRIDSIALINQCASHTKNQERHHVSIKFIDDMLRLNYSSIYYYNCS